MHRGSSACLPPEMQNGTRLAHWAAPRGAEQVLQELGNHVEGRRAPWDGFGAAESLRAPATLRFVVLFCGVKSKKKKSISACSRVYSDDVEVLMQGNIPLKNMCIGWWPCIVPVYIFIHPFSVAQAWLENNRASQAARINQFSVLNAFQAILLGPEQTICFYKGICFTKHLQSWTPTLEDKQRWIHAGF